MQVAVIWIVSTLSLDKKDMALCERKQLIERSYPEVKLPLCLIKHTFMTPMGVGGVQLRPFLTWAPDGGERSDSRLDR
jgi:hypothetical protein